MPEETIFDPTDRGTVRPNTKPLHKKGDGFYPMQLSHFRWESYVLGSGQGHFRGNVPVPSLYR